MVDKEVVKQALKEYKDHFNKILWTRNIIEQIGIKEFDELLEETWKSFR
jgi:hypothetical protein